MAKRIFEVAKEFGVKAPQIIELLGKYYISKTNFDKINDDELLIMVLRLYSHDMQKKVIILKVEKQLRRLQ